MSKGGNALSNVKNVILALIASYVTFKKLLLYCMYAKPAIHTRFNLMIGKMTLCILNIHYLIFLDVLKTTHIK